MPEGVDVASVWISTDPARNPIDAPFLFLVHGQTPPTLKGFERVFNLFDGRSEAQTTDARVQWKKWKIPYCSSAIVRKLMMEDGRKMPERPALAGGYVGR